MRSRHHTNIDAETTCADGVYTVDYDSWSWVSADGFSDTGVPEAVWRGLNSNIEVSYSINGGSMVLVENGAYFTGGPTISKVAGGSAHPFPVVSGSFELPGGTTGTVLVRSRAVAQWGPGPNGELVAGGEIRETTFALGGDCNPEPEPEVGAVDACAAGGISIELINNGDGAATFTVNGTDTVVGPNSSTTVTVPANENETVHITITSGGQTLMDEDVLRDCLTAEPEVGDVIECAAGGIQIELINNGDEAATFTVNGVDTTVGPNSTETITLPADENETIHITITSGGQTLMDEDVVRDCLTPEPDVGEVNECANGGISVELINNGDDFATFTVNGDDTIVDAHSTETVTVPAAEDSTVHITITSGGQTLFDEDVTRDCQNPEPSVGNVNECAPGGIRIRLINDGDQAATFTVNGDDTTVGPNSSEFVTVPADEDSTVHITITSGGDTLFDEDVTRDCRNPSPSVGVVNECATGGIAVELVNDGDDDATFTVNGDDTTVGPNSSETVIVPAAENTTVQLTVTSGGDTLFDDQIRVDCLHPAPDVKDEPVCAAGGIGMNLNNEAGLDEATFTVNGVDVVVPAGQTVQHIVSVAEDSTVHILVTSGGQTLFDQDVTRNCVAPTASIVHTCTSTGTAITLTNPGTEAIDLTIIRNGTTVETLTIAGGATVVRSYTMAEDETSTFQVTGPNFDSGVQSVTRNCVEVLGTQITRDGSLAATGARTGQLALVGFLLLAGGAVLLVGSQRRSALAVATGTSRSRRERGSGSAR